MSTIRAGFWINLVGIIIVLQLLLLFPRTTRADGISGFAEYNFSKTESDITDIGGPSIKSSGSALIQRYNLAVDRTLYPNLHFSGGGNVELGKSDYQSDSADSSTSISSKQTKMFPWANLRLNTGATSAAVGYSRRQEKMETSGVRSITTINDNYNAQFGVRPEGFPTVDLIYSHLDNYDADRTAQNMSNDSATFNTKYSLLKNLDLTYQALFNNLQDKLRNQEVRSINQGARLSYSGSYFKDRVTLYSSYNISSQETRIKSGGIGEVSERVTPNAGFFKITELPDTLTSGSLDPFDAVLGGNANITILNFKMPVGLQDNRPRSMGLYFALERSLNVVRVLVDQDLGIQSLYTRFTWTIYTSSDGVQWGEPTVIRPENITFGNLVSNDGSQSYGFELRFPTITTTTERRYVKVVTTPVYLTAPPPGITVDTAKIMKVEGYFNTAAPIGIRRSNNLSGHYEMNSRVKLLEKHSLFYDLNFTLDHFSSDDSSSQRYSVSNSLSLAHQFNSVFSGNARIMREDSFEASRRRSSWLYTASVTAVPVPTLTSSLLFSGRNESSDGAPSSSYSLYLNNSAQLYRGLSVLLNGGVSRSLSAEKRQSDNAVFMFSASLLPHPMANVNINVTGRKEWSQGGGVPDATSYKQDNELTLTLNPVRSIYLFGSASLTTETGKETQFNRGMGGSWAPLRDGNLLLNISYNETAASSGSQTTRGLVQSLRWYFRPNSYFDVSYLINRSSSMTQQIDSYSLNAGARFAF